MKFFLFILGLLISTGLLSQQVENIDTSIYTLKAKLLKAEPLPPHCGIMAWAMAQKFKIIESSFYPVTTIAHYKNLKSNI